MREKKPAKRREPKADRVKVSCRIVAMHVTWEGAMPEEVAEQLATALDAMAGAIAPALPKPEATP